MNGFSNITTEQYHADPCSTPSLSASVAKTLIEKSPYHAWLEHPRLGGKKRESTREMDRGTIIHGLILNQPLKLSILAHDNYRTKAAQEERDVATENGFIPVLAREYQDFRRCADAVLAKLNAIGIEFDGETEAKLLWQEFDRKGEAVQCRSMFDHISLSDMCIIDDLKTTTDASPKACVRSIINYGYDLQAAAYTRAIEQSWPEWSGRIKFRFIFIEESTNEICPIILDGAFDAVGRSKWRRAVNRWSECLKANHWPGYAEKPLIVTPPMYAIREEMDAEGSDRDLINFVE